MKYFGFDSFRSFSKFKPETDLFASSEEVSQRDIAQATLERKDILYLAPESLLSKNIERLLSYRYIERIVIDEAHCLSTWGNDFRHDYFYIAQFIQKIQDKKYA